jgi:hypothetical protein
MLGFQVLLREHVPPRHPPLFHQLEQLAAHVAHHRVVV